jgi:hypothetical protein
MAVRDMYRDDPMAIVLDELIIWLRRGITNLPRETAIKEAERWRQRIAEGGRPEWRPAGDRLASLAAALAADPIDVAGVGDQLIALGADITRLAAVENAPGMSARLEELSFALESEGVALTGRAADQDTAGDRPLHDIDSVEPGNTNAPLRGV